MGIIRRIRDKIRAVGLLPTLWVTSTGLLLMVAGAPEAPWLIALGGALTLCGAALLPHAIRGRPRLPPMEPQAALPEAPAPAQGSLRALSPAPSFASEAARAETKAFFASLPSAATGAHDAETMAMAAAEAGTALRPVVPEAELNARLAALKKKMGL